MNALHRPLYIPSQEIELLNSEASIETDDFAEQHQTALAVAQALNVNMISWLSGNMVPLIDHYTSTQISQGLDIPGTASIIQSPLRAFGKRGAV